MTAAPDPDDRRGRIVFAICALAAHAFLLAAIAVMLLDRTARLFDHVALVMSLVGAASAMLAIGRYLGSPRGGR